MNDITSSDLGRESGRGSEGTGSSPSLWRRVLAAAGPRAGRWHWSMPWRQRVPGWGLAAAAAAMILLAIGIASHQRLGAAKLSRAASPRMVAGYAPTDELPPAAVDELHAAVAGRHISPSGGAGELAGQGPGTPELTPPVSSPLGDGRQVVRRATIELAVPDVRTAFFKVSHLVSEAHGEYVQDSSLAGHNAQLRGTLTLRVTVGRLSEVLNQLRTLGEVRSENSGGEDVTAQAVDIEARLRNEQRVERELLELLEKRADAPLKEILELRSALAAVRQTIERLAAQRERLAGLVALATVAVMIVPADAPPPEATGLAAHFAQTIESAWRGGLTFLVETLAGLLAVLVGGSIWWLVLVVVVLAVRGHWRRRATRAA